MRLANRFGRAVAVTMLIASVASQASAETLFHDTFSDGNAEDGMPVTWVPDDGVMSQSVENGSLIIQTVPDTDGFSFGDSTVETVSLTMFSIRTQIRLFPSTDGNSAGEVRGFGIVSDGTLTGPSPRTPTEFDPVNEDIIVQVDRISDPEGDFEERWIWRAGDPMPAEPNSTRLLGRGAPPDSPSLTVIGSPGFAGRAAFRYVIVADSHIPEPSSLLLAMLGMAGTCCYRRRRIATADFTSDAA